MNSLNVLINQMQARIAEQIKNYKPAETGSGSTVAVEVDPTIPSWAKEKTKPKYSAAEVGTFTKEEITTKLNELKNSMSSESGLPSAYYGICKTAGSERVKEIVVDDDTFSLRKGVILAIFFSNDNTYVASSSDARVVFNVNNTGNVEIKWNNKFFTTAANLVFGVKDYIFTYQYDGEVWNQISRIYDTNTTYTPGTLGFSYGIATKVDGKLTGKCQTGSMVWVAGAFVTMKFESDFSFSDKLNYAYLDATMTPISDNIKPVNGHTYLLQCYAMAKVYVLADLTADTSAKSSGSSNADLMAILSSNPSFTYYKDEDRVEWNEQETYAPGDYLVYKQIDKGTETLHIAQCKEPFQSDGRVFDYLDESNSHILDALKAMRIIPAAWDSKNKYYYFYSDYDCCANKTILVSVPSSSNCIKMKLPGQTSPISLKAVGGSSFSGLQKEWLYLIDPQGVVQGAIPNDPNSIFESIMNVIRAFYDRLLFCPHKDYSTDKAAYNYKVGDLLLAEEPGGLYGYIMTKAVQEGDSIVDSFGNQIYLVEYVNSLNHRILNLESSLLGGQS